MQKKYKNVRISKLIVILMCLEKLQGVLMQCNKSQWSCDDASCIPDHKKCDGGVDCPDGSDETAENCIHLYKDCPPFAFKCSYGACITGTYRCNGVRNCVDNSDELNCSTEENWRGQCGIEEMQCLKSKECISIEDLCDGKRDCSDGSDETVQVCAGYECPKVGFHCGYGGCVDGNAKCNNTMECADGSDEAWELCGTERKTLVKLLNDTVPVTPKPIPTTTTTVRVPTKTTPTSPTTDDNDASCQIPEDITELRFKLHPENTTLLPGSWLEEWETLHIECVNKAPIRSSSSLLCVEGKFDSKFPKCLNYCNGTLLKGLSTIYHCYDGNDRYIQPHLCKDRIVPGTKIEIVCLPGFMGSHGSVRQTITCLPNGHFNETRRSCVQDCGYALSAYVPLTTKGTPVKPSAVPWHVAIYELDNQNYTYICSGSIVSPSIVISAAHCFYDNRGRKNKERELFQLYAGKYSKIYGSTSDGMSQMRTVQSIILPKNYRGNRDNYRADIAIVKLNDAFVYNENISSICVPALKLTGSDYVPPDISGYVTGYGKDFTLERVDMITRDYYQCLKKPEGKGLTDDKFCLYNANEGNVCRGDSGGGFVQMTNQTYHLLGIISYTPSTTNDCARNGFVGVTNVRFMAEDLRTAFSNELIKENSVY